MPSPARLFNGFRAASTNECLNLSLSWRASKNPLKRPLYGHGAGLPRLAKESFALFREISAGWMPESVGRWSDGVEIQ